MKESCYGGLCDFTDIITKTQKKRGNSNITTIELSLLPRNQDIAGQNIDVSANSYNINNFCG